MLKNVGSVTTSFQIINQNSSTKKEWILLHGWGCTWEIWSPLIAELPENVHVIIPDLPAFGQSAEPDTVWSSYQYAQWVTQLIKEFSTTRKVALIGHSFGGKIASIVAATHPELISHLVIVDASGLPDPLPLHRKAQEKLVSIIPSAVKEKMKSTMKQTLSRFIQLSPDYLNATQYQRAVLRKILKENINQELSTITVPTTIIWGTEDQATPLRHGEEFHKLIPHSTFKPMKDSGHFPFIDQPKEFLSILNTSL